MDASPPVDSGFPPRHGRVPTPRASLLLLVGVALLYLVGGVPLQLLLGEVGLGLAQLLFLLGPAVAFVVAGGYDPVRTLSLRLPPRGAIFGGLILLAGATPLAWYIAWLQSFVLEVPVEMLEAMSALIITDNPWRVLWLLVLVALIPAVAEETLFRGALLGGLRSRMSVLPAVLLCGFVFGLFHLGPGTAFRFLPTAWLGVVLAWVVWESRSLLTGIVLHFVNNAAIVLLTVVPATREVASDTEGPPPLLLFPVALVLLVVGVRAVRAASRAAEPPSRTPG